MIPDPPAAGEPGDPVANPPKIPQLPQALLDPARVIAAGALAWVVVTVLAFAVPALHEWRPVCVAGLATGLLGTSIFLWQKNAARRGARGAQTGLTFDENPD
jgi:hypothetical protein